MTMGTGREAPMAKEVIFGDTSSADADKRNDKLNRRD